MLYLPLRKPEPSETGKGRLNVISIVPTHLKLFPLLLDLRLPVDLSAYEQSVTTIRRYPDPRWFCQFWRYVPCGTYCTYLLSFGLKLFPPTRVISLQLNSAIFGIRNLSLPSIHFCLSDRQYFLLGQMPLFGGIATWNHQSVLYLARYASSASATRLPTAGLSPLVFPPVQAHSNALNSLYIEYLVLGPVR